MHAHTELKTREPLLNACWWLGSPWWRALGDARCSQVWWATLRQLSMNYNSFKAALIHFATQGSFGEYISSGSSAMQVCITLPPHKYLVIVCITVAPGNPRARLCLALQKHQTPNPAPARHKKMVQDPLLRGNLHRALMGTVSSSGRKRRKQANSFIYIFSYLGNVINRNYAIFTWMKKLHQRKPAFPQVRGQD